jgi:hypothetical protein
MARALAMAAAVRSKHAIAALSSNFMSPEAIAIESFWQQLLQACRQTVAGAFRVISGLFSRTASEWHAAM